MSSINIVQSNSAKSDGGSTTPSVTLGSAPTHNNLLVAAIAANESPGDVSISLAGWTLLEYANNSTRVRLRVAYKIAGVSESATVTGSLSGNRRWAMYVCELSNVRTASPIDDNGTNSGLNQPFDSGSFVSTEANELWLAFFGIKSTVALDSPTNGFTELLELSTPGGDPTDVTLGVFALDVSGTGTAQTVVNGTEDSGYVTSIAGFVQFGGSVPAPIMVVTPLPGMTMRVRRRRIGTRLSPPTVVNAPAAPPLAPPILIGVPVHTRIRRSTGGGLGSPQVLATPPSTTAPPIRVDLATPPRARVYRTISGLRSPLVSTPGPVLRAIKTSLAPRNRKPRWETRGQVGSPQVISAPIVGGPPVDRAVKTVLSPSRQRVRRQGSSILGPPREVSVPTQILFTLFPNLVTMASRSSRVQRQPRSFLGAPGAVTSYQVSVPLRFYFASPVRAARKTRSRIRPVVITVPPPTPLDTTIQAVLANQISGRIRRKGPRSVLVRPRIVSTPSQFSPRAAAVKFPRRPRRIHPRTKLRPPTVVGPYVPPPPPPARQPCATGPLPYLKFGDVEIANVARTVEYLRNGLGSARGPWELSDCGVCPVLYTVDSDDCTPATFVSPAADPAPWYDAAQPGSSSFLGLVLLDISGYDSTITREVTPRTQGLGGASFSGQRRNPRTWKFRAALVSADDVGAEYGLRWLTKALQASSCATCDTGNLTVRLVCPPEDCTDDDQGAWMSYDVVLTGGPIEVEKWAPGGGQDALYGCRDIVGVEWEMTAGNPLLYKPATQCLAPEILGENVECDDICDFLFGDPGEAHCCTITPPARGTLGAIITLQSVSGMNSVLLGAYANCPTGSEDNPILEMELSGVPAGGTVEVDSARRTITVTAPDEDGNLISYDGQQLIVLDERPLQWLEARACDDITCFCVRTAHPCSQGGDTLVSISTQLREG